MILNLELRSKVSSPAENTCGLSSAQTLVLENAVVTVLPVNKHSMHTRSKNNITKPVKKMSLVAVSTPLSIDEPPNVTQVMKDH